MSKRLFFFYLLLIACYMLLIVQLAVLQIVQGKRNRLFSEDNRIKIERIKAERGIIYDRQEEPLVYNVLKNTSDGGRLERSGSHDSSEVE